MKRPRKKAYVYAKKITPRARNLTKLEKIWVDLCTANHRDCWIQWQKTEEEQEIPVFHSCDIFEATDGQQFDTIEKAIEWEKGYSK